MNACKGLLVAPKSLQFDYFIIDIREGEPPTSKYLSDKTHGKPGL